MFGKRSMFKSVVAIAVAASIAVVGAKSATAGNPYNPSAYVFGGASERVAQSIQSTGNGSHRSAGAKTIEGGPTGYLTVTPIWYRRAVSAKTIEGGPTGYLTVTPRQSIQSVGTPAPTGAVDQIQSQDSDHQRFVTAMQNIRAAQVAQSIQSQDSEYQRFVTAARNLRALRAARVHGFTIITDTLGGNGTAKLLAPGGSRTTMQ